MKNSFVLLSFAIVSMSCNSVGTKKTNIEKQEVGEEQIK
jgi:hypothetical protein